MILLISTSTVLCLRFKIAWLLRHMCPSRFPFSHRKKIIAYICRFSSMRVNNVLKAHSQRAKAKICFHVCHCFTFDYFRFFSLSVKGLFTRTVHVTVLMSGTFDLFDVTCEQHLRTALNPFLNGTKNGDIDGTSKRILNVTGHIFAFFGSYLIWKIFIELSNPLGRNMFRIRPTRGTPQ